MRIYIHISSHTCIHMYVCAYRCNVNKYVNVCTQKHNHEHIYYTNTFYKYTDYCRKCLYVLHPNIVPSHWKYLHIIHVYKCDTPKSEVCTYHILLITQIYIYRYMHVHIVHNTHYTDIHVNRYLRYSSECSRYTYTLYRYIYTGTRRQHITQKYICRSMHVRIIHNTHYTDVYTDTARSSAVSLCVSTEICESTCV